MIVSHPGPRPKRPAKPRRPKEKFRRTEVVWTSEEEDILFADLLHLIPSDTLAQNIRLNIERNPINGYPYVTVTYEHDIPNTRFDEQQLDYVERLERYESDVITWEIADNEWLAQRDAYEIDQVRLHSEFKRLLDEQLDELDVPIIA